MGILAAAQLAPQELAREQARAQREQAWVQSIPGIAHLVVDSTTQGLGAAKTSAEEQANTAAQDAVNAGKLDPLDKIAQGDSFNPFRSSALAKARATAGAGIEKKQKEADALTYAHQQDALARQDRLDAAAQAKELHDNDLEAARVERENARMAAADAATQARIDREHEDEAKLGADKRNAYFDLIQKKQAHLIPDDVWNEYFPGVAKPAQPSTSGAPSIKSQIEAERLKALQAKNAAGPGGKKGGIISPEEMKRKVDEANELAALYDKGGFGTGVAAATGVGPLASDDLLRARQLSTELAFGVPAAFSGSRRLNDTEFKKSLSHIAGAPESAMTNKQKAQMARALAADLGGMLDEMTGAGADAQPPSTEAPVQPQHGASGSWQADLSAQMDKAMQPAMTGTPAPSRAAAAVVRVTDGRRVKTVPLAAWQTNPVPGWRVMQ